MSDCASWHALACRGEGWAKGRRQWGGTTARVSVRVLHRAQLLTGFRACHAHGSSSSRRLTGCPSTMRESTSCR